MNDVQFFLEFTIPKEAKRVMESRRRWFMGGSLKLEWSPKARCVKSLETNREGVDQGGGPISAFMET